MDFNQYHNYLCNEWNFVPDNVVSTGYEDVMDQLIACSKAEWLSRDEAGRQQLQQQVFDIYRERDILPIFYYSLQG